MSEVGMLVKVRLSAGTYTARIHKVTASCAESAEKAVSNAAEKYIANLPHVSIISVSRIDDENYRVVFDWRVP